MGLKAGAVVTLLAALGLSSAVNVWEFGKDEPGSTVVFEKTGSIRFWDKVIEVPVRVAPCMKVVYVRVQVENPISNPAVTYKEVTTTVLIEYGLVQSSKSWYEIIAKAIPTYCEGIRSEEVDVKVKYPQPDYTIHPEIIYLEPKYQEPKYPSSRYPDPRYFNSRYPDPRYYNSRYRESKYQDLQPGYPDSRYAEPSNLQTSFPDSSYPARNNPQSGYSEFRYSEPDIQQPGYPDSRYPEPNPRNKHSRYLDPGYLDLDYPQPGHLHNNHPH